MDSINIQTTSQLRNYHFALVYRGYGMIRKLCGNVYNRSGFEDGDLVYLSRLVEYDEVNKLVTTRTNHVYKLINCSSDAEEVNKEIYALIERGYYEIIT